MNRSVSMFAAVLMSIAANGAEVADSVFLNGKIYTVNESAPWAQAVAIKDGRFIHVGSNAEVRGYIGAATRQTDLHGRMMMPGIHDAHAHMLGAGAQLAFGCVVPTDPFGKDDAVLIGALKECEKRLQPGQWLVARPFLSEQFESHKPDRKFLDRAFPDRPVYLVEYTGHNGLANAKALEMAKIGAGDADPEGGKYVRDAAGRLTGELIERANFNMRTAIAPHTADQNRVALRTAIEYFHRYGITSTQEASSTRELLAMLHELETNDRLALNVWTHLRWTPDIAFDDPLIAQRKQYESRHVNVDNIKIFIDGTPTAPYFTAANFDEKTQTPDMSLILVKPDVLNEALRSFDAMGMRVKMHASGAGGAHVAIDAIEFARGKNPGSTIRHEVAHTNLIIVRDMERMKPLNITAELSPAVWDTYGEYLGNPPQKAWQFKTLAGKGMLMTIGTDWGVTALPNLFPAIQGTLAHGEESIDLKQTLKYLTLNGAIANGREHELGSIAAGKWANFIVLDRALFDIPQKDIGGTQVVSTFFEGRSVYEKGPSKPL